MLNATFRPLLEWPGQPTRYREPSRFRADYTNTLDLLERELDQLEAKDIVIQVAVGLKDIRNDGWIRSDARPERPGVVLNFTSKGVALQFACDRFDQWKHNLRAIGLTLESLRAVDRYGATKNREQYRGWAQLPPGEGYVPPQPVAMTRAEAVAFLAQHSGFSRFAVEADAEVVEVAYKRAAQALHPDRGGSGEQFLKLQRAVELLRKSPAAAA